MEVPILLGTGFHLSYLSHLFAIGVKLLPKGQQRAVWPVTGGRFESRAMKLIQLSPGR